MALVVVAAGLGIYLTVDGTRSNAAPTTLTAPPRLSGPPITLDEPVDRGTSIELSWDGQPGWTYAVAIAEAGEAARVQLVPAGTSYAVDVKAGTQYCFVVQGSSADGSVTGQSAPRGIRGASCATQG